MKPVYSVYILLLLFSLHASASEYHNPHDSSAIYYTKTSFDNHSSQLTCRCRVKVRVGLLWSDVGYQTGGTVAIKRKGVRQEFTAASIYGFYSDGIMYRYFKEDQLYLAVLADGLPVNFYLKDKDSVGFKYYIGSILYTSSDQQGLKKFSKANIVSEFSKDPLLLATLQRTLEKIGKYEGNMTHSAFRKSRQLIYEAFNNN